MLLSSHFHPLDEGYSSSDICFSFSQCLFPSPISLRYLHTLSPTLFCYGFLFLPAWPALNSVQWVPYLWTFKLQTFKDANVCSHAQSHKLVHMSGVHCYPCVSSMSGCAFVDLTVLNRVQWGFPGGPVVRNPPAMQRSKEMQVWSLGWEGPLEEGRETHSSILA